MRKRSKGRGDPQRLVEVTDSRVAGRRVPVAATGQPEGPPSAEDIAGILPWLRDEVRISKGLASACLLVLGLLAGLPGALLLLFLHSMIRLHPSTPDPHSARIRLMFQRNLPPTL